LPFIRFVKFLLDKCVSFWHKERFPKGGAVQSRMQSEVRVAQNEFKIELNQPDPRLVVTVLNFTLIGIVAAISAVWSILDRNAHYFPVIAMGGWCLLIQFLVRKKRPLRERWVAKRKWQEAAFGAYGILIVFLLFYSIPL
jgi:hypothetical protein